MKLKILILFFLFSLTKSFAETNKNIYKNSKKEYKMYRLTNLFVFMFKKIKVGEIKKNV